MADSERGRLAPPNLDDRTWVDLVDEARALIPTYAPQWTDHNPSDLGIALVELFAYLVEGLTYRLNRVPEKSYIAFLDLIGITRLPQSPAEVYLTFTANPGPATVPAAQRVQTKGSEDQEPFVFETDASVTVLQTNLKVMLKIDKVVGNKYSNISSQFTIPPALGGAFTVPAGQSAELCLGFDQQVQNTEMRLLVQFFEPIQIVLPQLTPTIDLRYSTAAQTDPAAWTAIPGTMVDGTQGFERDGDLRFTPANDWSSQSPQNDWTNILPGSNADVVPASFYWIGIRITNPRTTAVKVGLDFILFNAVVAHNALTVQNEALGASDGHPNQVFRLANRPVYKRLDTDTPYDHVAITVGGTPWALVDDLSAGAGSVYRLDPVTGEVLFGNYDPQANPTGNGSIPPIGNAVVGSYRYVAGDSRANVGAGTITVLGSAVPGIVDVVNLRSAFGGSDEEPIEDTKARGPEALRVRDRAVAAEDYEFLARESTTDVRIVRCLPPALHEADATILDINNNPIWYKGDGWQYGAIDRSRGNINVIVVPPMDAVVDLPEPSKELLREVQAALDHRRDVTAHLVVLGPRYLPVKVTVTAAVWKKAVDLGLIAGPAALKATIEADLRKYLHPAYGGLDGRGWQVGQHVYISDLFQAIVPPDQIGFISDLKVEATVPLYHQPPLGPGGAWNAGVERPFVLTVGQPWVRVADYELACWDPASQATVGQV